jgi:hypothetical protein
MGWAQIGLYLILFSSAGGMLLPALIIIPAHFLRWASLGSPELPVTSLQ